MTTQTLVWLLLVVCVWTPVVAVAQTAPAEDPAPTAAVEEESVPPFEARPFKVGADGYTPEDDYKGPGGFLAYVYMILAFAFVLAPAFKNAKRTHLD